MRQFGQRKWVLLVVWATVAFLAGCQGEAPPTAGGNAAGDSAALALQQRELALAAKKDLFERLSGRLMEVMSTDGSAAAIDVCSQEALKITEQVGETHGVTIGRTSFRLRNNQNAPPSWAAGLIQQRVEEAEFVNLPNGQLGALLPIRLQPKCLICHGAKENIPEAVKQALATTYPDDQATGFELDALRGWFWVQVPPQ